MNNRHQVKPCQIIHQSWFFFVAIAVLLLLIKPVTAQAQSTADTSPTQISISPMRVKQGDVARITVTCPLTVTALSYDLHGIGARLFKDTHGGYSGFIPVTMNHTPGPTNLVVTLQNADNTTSTLNASFEVLTKDFPVQHLTVDESKSTLSEKNLARHNNERALILKMFRQSQPTQLWGKSFTQPLQGRISTPFGVKRFINKLPRNPHSGVDIAAPSGTPVKASAAGIVSLTGEHFFAGKSVYIDHGQDIFSMYFHLDSITVQNGQTVARGDIIGRVGATGRATGPHLHWGVRMYDTAINPFSLLTLFEE